MSIVFPYGTARCGVAYGVSFRAVVKGSAAVCFVPPHVFVQCLEASSCTCAEMFACFDRHWARIEEAARARFMQGGALTIHLTEDDFA